MAWLEDGIANMIHNVNIVKKAGIMPVVCVNVFPTDTEEEIKMIKRAAEAVGTRAPVSRHWQFGGDGALELADAVMDACREKAEFKLLYPNDMPLRKRIETIAREVYGADGVVYTPKAGCRRRAGLIFMDMAANSISTGAPANVHRAWGRNVR